MGTLKKKASVEDFWVKITNPTDHPLGAVLFCSFLGHECAEQLNVEYSKPLEEIFPKQDKEAYFWNAVAIQSSNRYQQESGILCFALNSRGEKSGTVLQPTNYISAFQTNPYPILVNSSVRLGSRHGIDYTIHPNTTVIIDFLKEEFDFGSGSGLFPSSTKPDSLTSQLNFYQEKLFKL